MQQTRAESVILPGLDISKPYLVLFKWQELPSAALLPFEKNKVLKQSLSYCVISYLWQLRCLLEKITWLKIKLELLRYYLLRPIIWRAPYFDLGGPRT